MLPCRHSIKIIIVHLTSHWYEHWFLPVLDDWGYKFHRGWPGNIDGVAAYSSHLHIWWVCWYMNNIGTLVALTDTEGYCLTLSDLTGDSSIPWVWTWRCTKISPSTLSQVSLIAIALKGIEKDSSSSRAKSCTSYSHSIYIKWKDIIHQWSRFVNHSLLLENPSWPQTTVASLRSKLLSQMVPQASL